MPKLICVLRPVDGETVYSLEAATARLSPSCRFVAKLTGGRGIFARPVWPVGLRRIVEAFPDVAGISADELLWRHTLVPAFAPLLSEDRRSALVAASLELNAGEPAIISGACAGGFSLAPTLRLCPRCVAQKDTRPCWKCVHQCDGVIVCPDHPGTVLVHTHVLRSPAANRKWLIDIRDARVTNPSFILDDGELGKAQAVALTMRELLTGNCAYPGPERFRIWLRETFREAGFGGAFGKVNLRELIAQFGLWLTPNLSATLGVPRPTEVSNSNWIVRLLDCRVGGVHPLKAALMTALLGVSIREALGCAAEMAPIRRATRPLRRGIPPSYRRYERSKGRLRRLWPNTRLSIIAIGRQLGVKDTTVNRWAAKCGLPFPRFAVGIRPARGFKPRPTRPDFGCRLRAKQDAWIKLRRQNRAKLACGRLPARPVYQWLLRYAPRWLRRHPLKKHRPQQVDWALRDSTWSKDVRSAAADIRSRHPPARLSRTRLANHVGRQALLNHFARQLPKTRRAIDAVEEPHAAFVPRRLLALHAAGKLRRRPLFTALKKQPSLKSRPEISALAKLY